MENPLTHLPAPTRPLAILLVISACLFFVGLGRLPLLEPDEGRNAEVAREMLVSRDWITPHYDHLTYLDKPAFLFWMIAGTFEGFGISEWSARFPSALLALATAVLVWVMARRMSGRNLGLQAGIILATSPLVFVFARFAIFDFPLTFFVALALYLFWLSSQSAFSRPSLDAGAFAAMAIATLIKGPVGFLLPLISLAVYQALLGKPRDLRKVHWAAGWIIFLAITLPWFIEVSLRNPGFARYAFWEESLHRFFSGTHMHRSAGPWYYIPVYLAGFFPWSFFLLFAGWSRRARWRALRRNELQPVLFLLSWAGVIFVFFSISHSKLPGYVLPAVPALSILTAIAWQDVNRAEPAQVPDWLSGGFAVMILVGLIMAGSQFFGLRGIEKVLARRLPASLISEIRPSLFVGGVIILALGFLGRNMAGRSRRRRIRSMAFVVVALTAPLLVLRWSRPLEVYFNVFSSRRLARTILASPQRNLTVYGYYYFRTSLPFYLRRPVGLITADGDETTSNYVVARLNEARRATLRFAVAPQIPERSAASRSPAATLLERGKTGTPLATKVGASRDPRRSPQQALQFQRDRHSLVTCPLSLLFREETADCRGGSLRYVLALPEGSEGNISFGIVHRFEYDSRNSEPKLEAQWVSEPVLLTARELRQLSRAAPGPFLLLAQNNEVNELTGVTGALMPLWETWKYSVWEKNRTEIRNQKSENKPETRNWKLEARASSGF